MPQASHPPPAVTAPAAAGNIYFTTGGTNAIQIFNKAGDVLASNNASFVAGGVFIGWYSEGKLLLLNV